MYYDITEQEMDQFDMGMCWEASDINILINFNLWF